MNGPQVLERMTPLLGVSERHRKIVGKRFCCLYVVHNRMRLFSCPLTFFLFFAYREGTYVSAFWINLPRCLCTLIKCPEHVNPKPSRQQYAVVKFVGL